MWQLRRCAAAQWLPGTCMATCGTFLETGSLLDACLLTHLWRLHPHQALANSGKPQAAIQRAAMLTCFTICVLPCLGVNPFALVDCTRGGVRVGSAVWLCGVSIARHSEGTCGREARDLFLVFGNHRPELQGRAGAFVHWIRSDLSDRQ